MTYLIPKQTPSGAYPPPQGHRAAGTIPLTAEQEQMVREYHGFVTIDAGADASGAVYYSIAPNAAGWESWQAAHPEPEPQKTTEQRISDLESESQELYQALDMILTGVTE